MPSVRFAVDRDFYPRSPCGERLAKGLRENALTANFYPRSPCGERPVLGVQHRTGEYISIHALLAESDLESRTRQAPGKSFLSTLSLRRATVGGRVLFRTPGHISIHALLAESDCRWSRTFSHPRSYFYPRSPCGERHFPFDFRDGTPIFLSTLSLRRATHGTGL